MTSFYDGGFYRRRRGLYDRSLWDRAIYGGRYDPLEQLGSDLLAWWDADHTDLLTIDEGDVVSSWRDRVGGYEHTAADAARPAYDATGFAGRPVLTFDGTDDCMTRTGTTGLPTGTATCEIWVLFDQTDDSASGTGEIRYAFCYGGQGTEVHRASARESVSSVSRGRGVAGNGSQTLFVRDNVVDLTGRHFQRIRCDGTGVAISVDGSPLIRGSEGAFGTTTIRSRIGAFPTTSPALFWLGGIAAILVTELLSDAQAAALAAWLNSRRSL